jgi:hypothetical protein
VATISSGRHLLPTRFGKIVGRVYRVSRRIWNERHCLSVSWGLPLRENERRLNALRNREASKRIFIIGNGPSLLRTDVDRLRNDVTIASNAIFLLFAQTHFRPTYYTIEDYLVAEDRRNETASLKGFWKIFPEDLRRFIKPDERTIYINFVRNYEGFPRFSPNFERRVYWGGTVTFMNMQLAYYLGASKIYLIGIDHNYCPPTSRDKVQGTVITSAADDPNHFDPRYFGVGYRWHDPKVDRMEQAYCTAKTYFESRGVQIFNATDGGNLEVFPRVRFDSLF